MLLGSWEVWEVVFFSFESMSWAREAGGTTRAGPGRGLGDL